MAAPKWSERLWPASYGGVQFQFESDSESGGRDIVVHEIPHRDTPVNEDLGQLPRYFSGSAYLASDQVDSEAVSFTETLCKPGPGQLVVPIRGPVKVRCLTVERQAFRDRAGLVAFSIKFVREGDQTPAASVAQLRQQAYDGADAVATAASTQFGKSLLTAGQANYVVAAAVSVVQTAAATLDVIRTTNAVDPIISAKSTLAIKQLIATVPATITSDDALVDPDALTVLALNTPKTTGTFADPKAQTGATLIAIARQLADGMAASAAAGAMLQVQLGFLPLIAAPTYLSPGAATAAENATVTTDLARLAALTAWADSIVRIPFTSRQDALQTRGYVCDRFDTELRSASEYGAEGAALSVAVQNLRAAILAYLQRLIINLAPVVTVDVNDTIPALVMAWRLYADATREVDLVLRNGIPNPMQMPVRFQALSPSYPAPTPLPTVWPAP